MLSRPLLLSVLVLVGAGLVLAAAAFWSDDKPDPTQAGAVPERATGLLPDGGDLSLAETRATDIAEAEAPATSSAETARRKPALTMAQVMEGLRALDDAPPGADT